ncbi:MAG: hypothetical protein WCL14_01765 [Bacteroidota bacterium]
MKKLILILIIILNAIAIFAISPKGRGNDSGQPNRLFNNRTNLLKATPNGEREYNIMMKNHDKSDCKRNGNKRHDRKKNHPHHHIVNPKPPRRFDR